MNVFAFRKLSIISLFVAAIYAITVFVAGTSFVLTDVVPVLQVIDVCAAFICIFLLGLACFQKTRPVAAHGLLAVSYIFGMSNWMYAFVLICASPIAPICYGWAAFAIIFSLGSFLGFMAAFPACAMATAMEYNAPETLALFIVGLGLTYVLFKLSTFLATREVALAGAPPSGTANSGLKGSTNSAANSDTGAESRVSLTGWEKLLAAEAKINSRPTSNSPTEPAKLANSDREGSTNSSTNSDTGMESRGSLTGWEKFVAAEAKINSRPPPNSPTEPTKKVVPCPECSTKLSLPAGKTGQVKCPRCSRMFKATT
jgi:hypothetical protein